MPSEPLRLRDIGGTSAFRLTIGLGAVFAIGLLALLGLVYTMTARELTARTDRILTAQSARLMAAPPDQLPRQIADAMAGSNGFSHTGLIATDGERIAGDIDPGGPVRIGRPVEVNSQRGPLRMLAVKTRSGETVIVARDIGQIRYLRGRVLLILLASGMAILIGTAAAAVLLAVRPLRRVRDLQQVAREIAGGRLETRMPIAGRHDELDQIAGTVNLMVDEIGRVVAQVKDVTDAVAHDLRTPLSHVRARLLDLTRLPDAAPAAGKAIAELDLVLARFAALLRISEIEAGARRAHFAPVDLARLAAEAIELYEPLAEERGLELLLDAAGPAWIEGDWQLLLEAISNLLDNAIKFSRTTITLAITAVADGVSLQVRDDGPGIREEERNAVLRRFYRGSNAEDVPGSGLGLSIVVAIAHLHGLDLGFEDAAQGLAVTLRTARR